MNNCFVCDRINSIHKGCNKYFVKELDTGYVVIGDYQFFKGYTVFIFKEHISELHLLNPKIRTQYIYEMSLVGEAVYNAFNAQKMNYELLGNGTSHLHWHIFPRIDGDGDVKGPVWWTDKKKMYSDDVRPSDEELEVMKSKLKFELEKLITHVTHFY